MPYQKLIGYDERCFIEKSLKNGMSQSEIARALNVSRTTIHREVLRCGGEEKYTGELAEKVARELHDANKHNVALATCQKRISEYEMYRAAYVDDFLADTLRLKRMINKFIDFYADEYDEDEQDYELDLKLFKYIEDNKKRIDEMLKCIRLIKKKIDTVDLKIKIKEEEISSLTESDNDLK